MQCGFTSQESIPGSVLLFLDLILIGAALHHHPGLFIGLNRKILPIRIPETDEPKWRIINRKSFALGQRFLTFLVPRPLDKISKVVATHSNKFDFYTPIHHSLFNYCYHYDAFA